MKSIASLLSIFISLAINAQNMQWAYRVLEVSSENNASRKSKAYSAKQVLGKPNAFPAGIDNINAWQPKGNKNEEFIKVGFLTPIKAKQVVIAESFHPGFISKILAYDAQGNEIEIASYTPKGISATSRILNVNSVALNFYVLALKIVYKTEKDMPINVDAIGISESAKPYKFKPNPNEIIKSNMVAVQLDSNVNSNYPEMGPLVSPDGKTLYFSRSFHPKNTDGEKDKEDIWYSPWQMKTDNWGEAKNMGSPMNNNEPNFINSISPDGNTILLGNAYLPNGKMGNGASLAQRTSLGWSIPKTLKIEDGGNNLSPMVNYYLSNSRKILLISSDRKNDSKGERDLYASFLKQDSTWTKPLNLGKNINSEGTESAPFLAADDKTLYFTSDGFEGYGGSDVFISRRLDDSWQKWSDPENLGPIVNSSQDESYFTLNASGSRVYFTSQVNDEGDIDIFKLELPKSLKPLPVMLIAGKVVNSKTNEYVPDVKILFENLATGVEVGIAASNSIDGNFKIILPSGSKYGYLAEKQGFISVHANIDLTNMKEYEEYSKDIYLTPMEVGQTVVINNIFFDFDKYDLKKGSFLELNRLAAILSKNPSIQIEVSANTDNVGTEAYNDKLSINRADAVAKYLTAKSGADKTRIVLKSYGESNPIATNATAKGRQLNRRVQFKILATNKISESSIGK